MRRLFTLILLVQCISSSVFASTVPSFPTTSEVVGGIELPQSDGSQLNPKFETEVLRKFGFEDEWRSTVVGSIKVEMVNNYASMCGDKLGSDVEFTLSVFTHKKYDKELAEIVKKTDAVSKMRAYLSYQTGPTPEQYKNLSKIPANALSKSFVANWLSSGYLQSSRNVIIELAKSVLRSKCGS